MMEQVSEQVSDAKELSGLYRKVLSLEREASTLRYKLGEMSSSSSLSSWDSLLVSHAARNARLASDNLREVSRWMKECEELEIRG
ncbi:MAG: hypothetical protein SOX65_06485 [Porphyromonas sp.]|uniref:hypothetical protein n=1 Tax=Porphyromonas sp. TaxID=1924944 RepID=UPI002A82B8F5|nr:hypothetical protein [Porphyromonas sp.]MDY4246112.1 hypothetical protein [Porphyromonas sp.]